MLKIKKPEDFSIKLFYGENLVEYPKNYVGGSVVFFDSCNVDEVSMLELNSMLKEVGVFGRDQKFWYRQPGSDWENGCFELK